MNLSTLATRVKLDLGIYGIALPIENVDQMIIDIIEQTTLPVFSIYSPYEESMIFNMDKLKCIENTNTYKTWLLPEFSQRKLLYIKDIKYDDRDIAGVSYWGGTVPFIHSGVINNLLTMNAAGNLVNSMLPKLNFQFEHPRKVRVFNCFASHNLIFAMMFEHDKSLQSIPPTAEESFYELAKLDIKSALWNILKHYTTIQTAYGNIELKIDDWQEAVNERKQLIERWDDSYQLDLAQLTWS